MSQSSSPDAINNSVSIFSGSGEDESSQSSATQPPPPPVPAPPLWYCDDFWHCFTNNTALSCNQATAAICPGLGTWAQTPLSLVVQLAHPTPYQVTTCALCRDDGFLDKIRMVNREATIRRDSGFRNQLCHSCIRDEVELYWLRQGQPNPVTVQQLPRSLLRYVQQWPVADGLQDLCVCESRAVVRWAATHCHACRNSAWDLAAHNRYLMGERVLRFRNKHVISGKRSHNMHDTTLPKNLVPLSVVRKRAENGIGRLCPCGGKPKLRSTPEYITFCLACSGVRVDPANLPPDLQKGPVLARSQRRQSLRNPFRQTKGRYAARRDPSFRVNIECSWLEPEPWVGGV